jgi:hypothetical protein
MYNGRGLTLFLAMLAASAGCNHDSSVARVNGIVRLDGKPLTTGAVRFVPEAGRSATGVIQSDSTFTLGTYGKSDGAVIGTHKVAIIAYDAASDGRPAYEVRKPTSKSLVPERYAAIGTSKLTFEVKPGNNQAEFDLRSGR